MSNTKAVTNKNASKVVSKRSTRKFETLKVLKTSPVILTDQLGKTKLHFVV